LRAALVVDRIIKDGNYRPVSERLGGADSVRVSRARAVIRDIEELDATLCKAINGHWQDEPRAINIEQYAVEIVAGGGTRKILPDDHTFVVYHHHR